jgi:two-component system sensor histidine kinase TctE
LPVQVVQLLERAEIDGLGGDVIVSVWQDLEQRKRFTAGLLIQGMVIAGLLVLTASLVVVFGIRIGLRPLESIEEAILRRTGTELGPIRRQVPVEVRQIVRRLNALFAEVTAAQEEKDRFISNAAHQLRNPIAGIQSLAEVTQDARTLAEARQRNGELIDASRQLAHLTEQLLSYERLHYISANLAPVRLDAFLETVARGMADRVLGAGLDFAFDPGSGDAEVMADPMLLEQAVVNIVDNAMRHGGQAMTMIQISSHADATGLKIRIKNDGRPIPGEARGRLFERFEQGAQPAAGGAGLGLAIVNEICVMHGGSVAVDDSATGFVILLPMARSDGRQDPLDAVT